MSDMRGEPMMTPPSGMDRRLTPLSAMNPAARVWPASFVVQWRSQMSSTTPSAHSIVAAPAMPMMGPGSS